MVETYAKDLTELLKTIGDLTDPSQVHRRWDECFKRFVENLAPDATSNLSTIVASSRERVALYRNLLWVWHRLDSDRWEKSQVQLRVGKKKATTEVDHVVSFALWEGKLQSGLPKQVADQDEALALANKLGNCSLLEKNFNISKSDRTLKSFLSQIHEVRENEIRIDAWCAALAIPQPLLDPGVAGVDEIDEAIENRDQEIRNDLADFVRGQKVRVDGDTVPPHKSLAAGNASSSLLATKVVTGGGTQADGHEFDKEMNALHSGPEDQQDESSGEPVRNAGHGIDLEGLCAAYKEDSSVRLIIDHFAGRERSQNETHVERLETLLSLSGATLSRSMIIRAFRRLDVLGLGRLIAGRKGHATRFEWYEKSLNVRGLATSYAATVEQQASNFQE